MDKKRIYLTIDDSPSENMNELVNTLLERNISAVFFCIGEHLERFREEAIYAIQKGFILGNHSWSHKHFSNISLETCYREITKTDNLLNELYTASGTERPAKWFRFPYGDKGDGRKGKIFKPLSKKGEERLQIIQTMLKGLGYFTPTFENISYKFYRELEVDHDWHWTFDLMDWSLANKKIKNIDEQQTFIQRLGSAEPSDTRGEPVDPVRWIGSQSDEILLMHDHKETTVLIPQMLDLLTEMPLTFQPFASIVPPMKQS